MPIVRHGWGECRSFAALRRFRSGKTDKKSKYKSFSKKTQEKALAWRGLFYDY
jgi:hypothetical protein